VLTHVEDCLSYLNAADLVVTMAGYNSLWPGVAAEKEIARGAGLARVPSKQMRARLFAERGLADVIFPGICPLKRWLEN